MTKNICTTCPLNSCPKRGKVTVCKIVGGTSAQHKLNSLGILPGKEINLIKSGCGPCIVSLGANNVVIGNGLANKVLVKY